MINKALIFSLLTSISLNTFAQVEGYKIEKWQNDTKEELENVFNLIENNYAPLSLKRKTVRLNWPTLQREFREKVDSIRNRKDYFMMLAELFASLNDTHVGLSIVGNHKMRAIPMQFAYVDGKTIISYIRRDQLLAGFYPFKVGDELVAINGISPDEMRQKMKKIRNTGNEATNNTVLTQMFTAHSDKGMIYHLFPQSKEIQISIKTNDKVQSYKIPWIIQGFSVLDNEEKRSSLTQTEGTNEYLKSFFPEQNELTGTMNKLYTPDKISFMNAQSSLSLPQGLQEISEGAAITIGQKEPFFKLPNNFKQIKIPFYLKHLMKEPGNLLVGTFKRDEKTIGFMRISSYMPDDFSIETLLAYRYYINQLENNTDVLFIDQSYNPGGNLWVADWITSLLTTGDYTYDAAAVAHKPSQKVLENTFALNTLINQIYTSNPVLWLKLSIQGMVAYETIRQSFNQFDELAPAVNFNYLSEVFDIMLDEYLESLNQISSQTMINSILIPTYPLIPNASLLGKIASKYLTFDISGMLDLRKHPYSKPITMLINEASISCGDIVPANLKDNFRVHLIGTRTAGAGGSVTEYKMETTNHFSVSLTNSLIERSNESYIENKGIRPHTIITPTIDDYKNGFAKYFEKLLKISKL